MPLNNNALNAMANHLASIATHASLHSADPGATGTSETSAARQQVAWGAAANGDITLSTTENFTGGVPNGAVLHVGLWTAATGGTFLGSFPLTGDTTFNSAGEYTLNSITVNGSAS